MDGSISVGGYSGWQHEWVVTMDGSISVVVRWMAV